MVSRKILDVLKKVLGTKFRNFPKFRVFLKFHTPPGGGMPPPRKLEKIEKNALRGGGGGTPPKLAGFDKNPGRGGLKGVWSKI